LSAEDQRRRSHAGRLTPGLDIATYDRFIEIAQDDKARAAAIAQDLALREAEAVAP
jgi:hypothetical protein